MASPIMLVSRLQRDLLAGLQASGTLHRRAGGLKAARDISLNRAEKSVCRVSHHVNEVANQDAG